VKGFVADPAGALRSFSPLLLCVEDLPLTALQPGESIKHSITLLRGAQGALFPMPGPHQITVEVHWDSGGLVAVVVGTTDVMVTSVVDEGHAQAALKVLSTPDALLTLVLGGDHLEDGIAAIQAAMDDPTLRPHFAYVEAKRVGRRFDKRKANLRMAAQLLDESTVMSPAEIEKAVELVKAEGADTAPGKEITKTLKSKAGTMNVSEDIKSLVDSL
jgi:hypothetical protein